MNNLFATLVLSSSLAAPVPHDPPPDPLAWGYLGVRVAQGNLVIASVEPNTPAARAGLHAEDRIVKIGSLEPRTFEDVVEHICDFRPGTVLRVEVRRNGEAKRFTVRLGVRPAELPPPRLPGRQPIPLPRP
jgi:serine protease Do